jgi:hypothetical protein
VSKNKYFYYQYQGTLLYLELDTLASNVIEDELGARLPDGVDAARYPNLYICQRFTVLQQELF